MYWNDGITGDAIKSGLFNSNMGCIEMSEDDVRTEEARGLTVTWDVLKFHPIFLHVSTFSRLTVTWDVLKLLNYLF